MGLLPTILLGLHALQVLAKRPKQMPAPRLRCGELVGAARPCLATKELAAPIRSNILFV
jgi:hypothetical protein